MLMATERQDDWAKSTPAGREYHIGHFHHKKSLKLLPAEDVSGVLIRVIPSLTPLDAWHSSKGYGSKLAAEAYYWDPEMRSHRNTNPQPGVNMPPKEEALIVWACYEPAGYSVSLTAEDLVQHMLVLGSTGSGKTTLLMGAIQQLLRHPIGLLILDAKQDGAVRAHHADGGESGTRTRSGHFSGRLERMPWISSDHCGPLMMWRRWHSG